MDRWRETSHEDIQGNSDTPDRGGVEREAQEGCNSGRFRGPERRGMTDTEICGRRER